MQKSLWASFGKTDIGTVRKVNEDEFFDDTSALIWCVADGMGGHKRGDLASQLITRELANMVQHSHHEMTVQDLVECVKLANGKLVDLSVEKGGIVGSTVAILLLDKTHAHCIWAGDSRVYRLRNTRLQRLTRDHSQVEDMIDAGLIKPEEAESHPKANVITRAVGASHDLELECKSFDLLPSDRFLLCSDGLNKVLNDAELEYLMLHSAPEGLANELINKALDRGARDNVTVITVHNRSTIGRDMYHTLPLDSTLPLNFQG